MNTTVEKLLPDIRLRLNMQKNGTVNPSDQVKQATKVLVEKLSKLDSKEQISTICGVNSLVKYERLLTGEVLAEIYDE